MRYPKKLASEAQLAKWGADSKLIKNYKSAARRAAIVKKASELVEPELTLSITLPVEVKSDQNVSKAHWAVLYRFKKAQREALAAWMLSMGLRDFFNTPANRERHWAVQLTRLGSGTAMDAHENLPQCFKAVVDEIASWLGVDDGDKSRVSWTYHQIPEGKAGINVLFQRIPKE